ncbi:MAG: hypothetical protein ACP5I0_09370 [Dictyoglomus sp.]|uniref:hypothetical protein n=1 Tax=Dictyoglomus sp. TaxID=28205 RepID=UPI003D0D81FB
MKVGFKALAIFVFLILFVLGINLGIENKTLILISSGCLAGETDFVGKFYWRS